MRELSLIRKVTALEDYRLRVVMGSGNIVELDFKPKIDTVRFWDLRDLDVFNAVKVEGDFLVFGNGFRMGASEIRDMMMCPRELKKEELEEL